MFVRQSHRIPPHLNLIPRINGPKIVLKTTKTAMPQSPTNAKDRLLPRDMEPRPQATALGVLAGHDLPDQILAHWASRHPDLFAADGAADRLVRLGFKPTVIGDLDSTSLNPDDPNLNVIFDPHPDFTDCEKLINHVADRGFERLLLTALEGDELAHLLGNISAAARSPIPVRLLLRTGFAEFITPTRPLTLDLPLGTKISFLAVAPSSGLNCAELRWPLDHFPLHPLALNSLSNETTAPRLTATLAEGSVLAIAVTNPYDADLWPILP